MRTRRTHRTHRTRPIPRARRGVGEAGFTLAETLVTIVVLGIVTTLLSKAIVMGLRFTSGTERRVAATGAAGALARWFTGDVQSADAVTTEPACGITEVVVHLRRAGTDVVYAHDPVSGALSRVTCGPAGVVSTPLGRLDPGASPRPVNLSCGAETPCASPAEVTLTVRTDPAKPPTTLTAVRRSTPS
ncbi:type II secretion system protein (plasmid) [Streptomyces sp. BI20]|uniref:type II secretion system protein n=1 Tax=Streptomyces sp. BI20 TaxID=3403460 RepID=UPI003C753DA7